MNDETRQLVYSAIQTPDGTIIESLHRHDYNTHVDKNGKTYMIDGGLEYVRCNIHNDQKWVGCYLDEPFEKVRLCFHWGKNYDEHMNRLPRTEYVKLCEMNDGHLDAVIDYPRVPSWCNELFKKEKKYRASSKDIERGV